MERFNSWSLNLSKMDSLTLLVLYQEDQVIVAKLASQQYMLTFIIILIGSIVLPVIIVKNINQTNVTNIFRGKKDFSSMVHSLID